MEQVTGNEEAAQLGEEPEDADVNFFNKEVLTSGALVNQAEIKKLVQVMSSNAWTREPQRTLNLTDTNSGTRRTQQIPVHQQSLSPHLRLYQRQIGNIRHQTRQK